MRRFALVLALVPLVALAAAPASACKPAPPRTTEAPRRPTPPPTGDLERMPTPPPAPHRAPVNPWSDTDSARFDRLLDLMAAAIETVTPHKESVEDAEAALLKAIALHRTTVPELIAEGKALAARMQEQPEGFQEYVQARMGRIQRLSNDIAKLTPTQQQALSQLFTE